jgi:hypothetical protein
VPPACLPAVLVNGRTGDLLMAPATSAPALANPAFTARVPGYQQVIFAFIQVQPRVTRVVAQARGARVTAWPVTVTGCGHRFRLAGFALAGTSPGQLVLTGYSAAGLEDSLDLRAVYPGTSAAGGLSAGLWANLDTDPADPQTGAMVRIGAGRAGGRPWQILESLGLDGQCYTGAAGAGDAWECLPVQAVPARVALAWVPFAAGAGLDGYAGLASPRTAYAVVTLSDGSTRRLTPVTRQGRPYLALAVPARLRIARVSLFGRAGHRLATITSLPVPR